jgi:hypothetical protein
MMSDLWYKDNEHLIDEDGTIHFNLMEDIRCLEEDIKKLREYRGIADTAIGTAKLFLREAKYSSALIELIKATEKLDILDGE